MIRRVLQIVFLPSLVFIFIVLCLGIPVYYVLSGKWIRWDESKAREFLRDLK